MRYNLINFNHYVTQFDRHHQYIYIYTRIDPGFRGWISLYIGKSELRERQPQENTSYTCICLRECVRVNDSSFARLIAVNNALLCVIRLNKQRAQPSRRDDSRASVYSPALCG